ncbi:putative lipase [Pseudomonas frederiksbergensis]|uniref:hypothetical protein n=1 Tax=Pseudomonas frederiksbergensis TaxID=104087 RepID=UPI003D22795C
MHSELELHVWRLAQQTCDTSAFAQLIKEAVDSYKRAPGLDPLLRLHASQIGLLGTQVLRVVLRQYDIEAGLSENYVEVRSRLKTHIAYHLQWQLMKSGHAIDEMKEDHLGKDLGL